MWKSLSELPTLTEIFFGKGVDPAKYKGSMIPAYLSGKANGMTATKPVKKRIRLSSTGKIIKKKPIQEVKSATSKAKGKKAIAKKAPAKKSKTKSKNLDDLPFEGPQEKR
tara:strand:- start:229 stop:558 length:330 start_codon:yes stop_codon:yes gene_type:complete